MRTLIFISLRTFLVALLAASSALAFAQTSYPTKPIRWVVGYPAGGGSDFLARAIGHQVSDQLHQPVVIDNKPGAAGMIAADAVAKSPGDGYTIFTADNGILIYNAALYKKIPYDPDRDFAPIGLIARVPLVLVAAPNAGLSNIAQAIAALKSNPTKFSYAS